MIRLLTVPSTVPSLSQRAVTCTSLSGDVDEVDVQTLHDEGAFPAGSQLLAGPEPMEEDLGNTGGSGNDLKMVLENHFASHWELLFHSAELYIIGT